MQSIMDVMPLIVVAFILIIGGSLVTVIYYNRMKKYKNEIYKVWDVLKANIASQFRLINANINLINEEKQGVVIELISQYNMMATIAEVTVAYVKLEKIMYSLGESELFNNFKILNDQINSLKEEYNHQVLGYNNVVNGFPGMIISRCFGFIPEAYFPSRF